MYWDLILRFYGIDWLASVLAVLMIYFLGNKNKLGFVFGLAANLSWMAFALITASLPIFLSNIVFMALNIRGLLRWRAALV